mgnify:CR=1 FL=1
MNTDYLEDFHLMSIVLILLNISREDLIVVNEENLEDYKGEP